MKRLTLFFMLFSLLALAACAGQDGSPVRKYENSNISEISLGDMIVYSVQDTAGEMDIALFSGPLTPEERAKYFAGGKTPSAVNVFLIKKGQRLILVDAGWGRGGRVNGQALEELDKIGIGPEQIDCVMLTHMHGDHISGLLSGDKAVFPKAKILVARPESAFWLADSTLENASYKGGAELARKLAKAYQGRMERFSFGQTLFPGILALEAIGHTPGHTAFLLDGGSGGRMIIGGDFVHAAGLQFAVPEESARYDMSPEQAVASRRALMERAGREGLILAGMHIPSAGWGKVSKQGGGYQFTPLK